jgi:hypothetical protein
MKKDNLYITKLISTFSKQTVFNKSELRDFYRNLYDEFDENSFRRILYSLEKEKVIIKVDRGIYILKNNREKNWQLRKKFVPVFSPDVLSVGNLIQENFPYTKNLLWETRILHRFIVHQPGTNLVILEIEKESKESVFNFLENKYTGRVFLDPSRDMVERYVLSKKESILILPLISRSPHQMVTGILCPKVEKILVDIWSDGDRFFIFHGQELINIYEMIFHDYKISEKTFFGYAARRKVDKKIRKFITEKTKIKLTLQQGVNQ